MGSNFKNFVNGKNGKGRDMANEFQEFLDDLDEQHDANMAKHAQDAEEDKPKPKTLTKRLIIDMIRDGIATGVIESEKGTLLIPYEDLAIEIFKKRTKHLRDE